ncbi:hypothetical protein [Rhodococcus opacus]|uniref:Uncharacterized protein n=1 Tax=Rhodococcus opacus (strain B4) TaxID=632772 RepID=C1B987_RHOOB|nr:hypothetical protein [Rhodococcus opacus]BAH52240.1 hypothetical protein ROP_39930 [Rhodococcus opacus B4]
MTDNIDWDKVEKAEKEWTELLAKPGPATVTGPAELLTDADGNPLGVAEGETVTHYLAEGVVGRWETEPDENS